MSEGMLKNELDKEQKMLELGLEWGGPKLKGWGKSQERKHEAIYSSVSGT